MESQHLRNNNGHIGQPRTGLGSEQGIQAEEWRTAYHLALANAAIFLLMALIMSALETRSLAVILFAPGLFLLGSALSFLLMIRNGGELAAIAWFVLGSGIYFGIGAIAGGLHVHPHTTYLFGGDTLYLLRANLLNACSIFIVLAVAYPISNMHGLKVDRNEVSQANLISILQNLLPLIIGIAAIGVGLKFALFPIADNLLLRSATSKIYLIVPSCFLLLGMLWRHSTLQLKIITAVIVFLEVLNGLIGFTKYQVISAILALAIGMWLSRRSVMFAPLTLIIMAAIFAVINPLVTLGRAHIDYDAQTNSVVTRFAILVDAATVFYLDKTNSKGDSDPQSLKNISANPTKFTRDVNEMRPMGGRLRALATRFEVISIQGYLINEYNSGRSGKSLADPWAVLVPRALWSDKPILTRFGTELNAQYYFYPGQERPQTNTSIGPTYSAEAYWNYGPLGVVIVSILLGLGLGWFTRCWQQAMAGQDIAFLLIAFPVAIWASFVESWVVATYLGEFIIFVVLLLVARAASSLLRPLKL